jgi:hypothetical protein
MTNSLKLLLTGSIFTLFICGAGCGDEAVTSENDGDVRLYFSWSQSQDALIANAGVACFDLSWDQRDCKSVKLTGQLEDKNGLLGEPKEFVFTFTYSASMSAEQLTGRADDCKEDTCTLAGAYAPGQYTAEWVVPANADRDTTKLRITASGARGTLESVELFADSVCYKSPDPLCGEMVAEPNP